MAEKAMMKDPPDTPDVAKYGKLDGICEACGHSPMRTHPECPACGILTGSGHLSSMASYRGQKVCHSCRLTWQETERRLNRAMSWVEFNERNKNLSISRKAPYKKKENV